jgi:carboxyl-terminal processing protease
MRPTRSRSLLAIVPLLLASMVLCTGNASAQAASYEQLQTFSSLLNQIRTSYVDSVAYPELVRAAIDGVLSSLDPHSRFLRADDAERELAYDDGRLAGAGISFDEVDGQLTVMSVTPRGPGAKAGVAYGDRIISINDTSVLGLTADQAYRHVLGDKGRKIRMLLLRGSRLEPDSIRVGLKLDFIEARSVGVNRMLDAQTGYIYLSQFHGNGAPEMVKAIKDLQGQGARQLLLDLRGDPGGEVHAAVEIASLFLPAQSLVFRTVGRKRTSNQEFRTEKDGQFAKLPLMVLIDEGSASASEALVGALQDHDRALVLGRRSFGKALEQQAFPIPPQNDLVWLTVARISTPSGRVIQRSYQGLKAEQYYSFAGKTGTEADTSAVFHTDRGRAVRGGGGIQPDVPLPKTAALPPWFSVAADSGWIEAVADSVAVTMPKDPRTQKAWDMALSEWQNRLVDPLMKRVTSRLNIAAAPSPELQARLGRILAARSAEVRWGLDGYAEFVLANDPDIQGAMSWWPKRESMLSGSSNQ